MSKSQFTLLMKLLKVCLIVSVQNEVYFNTIIWEKNLSLIFLSYVWEILFIAITKKDVYEKAHSKFIKYFEYFRIQMNSK